MTALYYTSAKTLLVNRFESIDVAKWSWARSKKVLGVYFVTLSLNEVKGEGFKFFADPYLWIHQKGRLARNLPSNSIQLGP